MPLYHDAILVVDDDATEAMLIARAFRKCGFENPVHGVPDVNGAKNYLSGLGEYADREKYPSARLVLLDRGVPSSEDWELLRWVRKEPKFRTLPVVVFTGSENPEHERVALELGANAYHVKPQLAEGYEAVIGRIAQFWLLGGTIR